MNPETTKNNHEVREFFDELAEGLRFRGSVIILTAFAIKIGVIITTLIQDAYEDRKKNSQEN